MVCDGCPEIDLPTASSSLDASPVDTLFHLVPVLNEGPDTLVGEGSETILHIFLR